MGAPLWSDTGDHTGAAPTHLHHILPRNPTQTKYHLHAICPNEINRPCAIRSYQSPPNHAVCHYRVAVILSIAHANRTVCHYPIGAILSIAQGWQV